MKKTIYIFLFYVCFCRVNAQVNVKDSLALVDLYNSTDGPNWFRHNNWLTGPVSTWYGIGLTNKRVTEIYLESNLLKGILPSSLGNLTALQYLYLADNQLTDSLPSSIGNLVNLDILALDYNQLSGSIPSSLGNLLGPYL